MMTYAQFHALEVEMQRNISREEVEEDQPAVRPQRTPTHRTSGNDTEGIDSMSNAVTAFTGGYGELEPERSGALNRIFNPSQARYEDQQMDRYRRGELAKQEARLRADVISVALDAGAALTSQAIGLTTEVYREAMTSGRGDQLLTEMNIGLVAGFATAAGNTTTRYMRGA